MGINVSSNNKIKRTITNLVNNSTSNNINGYSFLTTTGRTYNNEISLYTNYNNLQIQSYSYLKNYYHLMILINSYLIKINMIHQLKGPIYIKIMNLF